MNPPQDLKNVAILQIVSGVLSLSVMACLSWFTIGTVMGLCTFWAFGIGGVCGLVGLLLVPVGIFEIISGVMGLTNPQGAGPIMKICSYVEMSSILFGGVTTAIAGGVAMKLMSDPEVVAFIEG